METRVVCAMILSDEETITEAVNRGLMPYCFTITEYQTICSTIVDGVAAGKSVGECVHEVAGKIPQGFIKTLLCNNMEFVETYAKIQPIEFQLFTMRGKMLRATKVTIK